MIPKLHCGTFGSVLDPSFIMTFAPTSCQRDGRYDDLAAISDTGGNGAFSVVFRARATSSGAPVALKFFAGTDMYRRLAFDREGKLLSTTFRNEDLFVKAPAGKEEVVVQLEAPDGRKVEFPLPFIAFEWMPTERLKRSARPRPRTHMKSFVAYASSDRRVVPCNGFTT